MGAAGAGAPMGWAVAGAAGAPMGAAVCPGVGFVGAALVLAAGVWLYAIASASRLTAIARPGASMVTLISSMMLSS